MEAPLLTVAQPSSGLYYLFILRVLGQPLARPLQGAHRFTGAAGLLHRVEDNGHNVGKLRQEELDCKQNSYSNPSPTGRR